MSAKVEVHLGRCQDVLAVPLEAVSVDHDHKVCYVLGPSDPERREITSGGASADLIEVVDGLKEGESVVLNPTRGLGGGAGQDDRARLNLPDVEAAAVLR
jgi:multidrug efflux pump subunit AcrA (membrane-fusion protein)